MIIEIVGIGGLTLMVIAGVRVAKKLNGEVENDNHRNANKVSGDTVRLKAKRTKEIAAESLTFCRQFIQKG